MSRQKEDRIGLKCINSKKKLYPLIQGKRLKSAPPQKTFSSITSRSGILYPACDIYNREQGTEIWVMARAAGIARCPSTVLLGNWASLGEMKKGMGEVFISLGALQTEQT